MRAPGGDGGHGGLGGLETRGSGPGDIGGLRGGLGPSAPDASGLRRGGDLGAIGDLGGKRPVEPEVELDAGPVTIASVDRALIRSVVHGHLAQIRYCYERALITAPGLFGKVVVEWTISAPGGVERARVLSSTLQHPPAEECIVRRVRGWRFPPTGTRGEVVIRYPFVFTTRG